MLSQLRLTTIAILEYLVRALGSLIAFISSLKFVLAVLVSVAFIYFHFRYLFAGADFLILQAKAQDFVTLVLSVILGALPFLVLGVSVSALVATYINEKTLLKLLPKNRFGSHIVISLLGMLMPVCECGNIPLARRLMLKGFSASQAITFLLAAPIINVVTIWSTFEAFRTEPAILVSRVVAGFIIANFIGILLSYKPDQTDLLSGEFMVEMRSRGGVTQKKVDILIDTFQREFWLVFRMLVLGAVVAGLIQTLIPRDFIIGIANSQVLSILVMMILGLIISMCSSVDAFFALSLSSIFNTGAIAAFLIFGPMIDVKILSMLKGSFKLKTLAIITFFVTMGSFITGLIINLLL